MKPDLLKCTIIGNKIGRKKAHLKNEPTQKNDRLQSGTFTETGICMLNSTDSPTRYKIVYTDFAENGKPIGL